MKEIYFITGNKGKLASAQMHLEKYEIVVLGRDLNIEEPYINDIEFVSKLKAEQAYKILKSPCFALDAGFYIKNYPGQPNFPGAFPKRDLLDKIGIEGLIEKMKNVKDRSCYFSECLTYFDGRVLKQFIRNVNGELATNARGINREQKWSELWSVFIPSGYDKVIGEFSQEGYIKFSDSKANAFDDLGEWLNKKR